MCCVLGATRLLSERSCSGRIDITECLIGTSVVCDVDRGVRVTSLASATVLCCVSLFLDLMLCGNPFRSCRFSAVCVSLYGLHRALERLSLTGVPVARLQLSGGFRPLQTTRACAALEL